MMQMFVVQVADRDENKGLQVTDVVRLQVVDGLASAGLTHVGAARGAFPHCRLQGCACCDTIGVTGAVRGNGAAVGFAPAWRSRPCPAACAFRVKVTAPPLPRPASLAATADARRLAAGAARERVGEFVMAAFAARAESGRDCGSRARRVEHRSRSEEGEGQRQGGAQRQRLPRNRPMTIDAASTSIAILMIVQSAARVSPKLGAMSAVPSIISITPPQAVRQ
jgi:hypothetical protein